MENRNQYSIVDVIHEVIRRSVLKTANSLSSETNPIDVLIQAKDKAREIEEFLVEGKIPCFVLLDDTGNVREVHPWFEEQMLVDYYLIRGIFINEAEAREHLRRSGIYS